MSETNEIKLDTKSSPNSPSQGSIGVLSRIFSFGSLGSKENSNPEPESHKNTCQVFYGVYIPLESKSLEEDSNDFKTLHVYTGRVEALKIVKKYKKARFKAFNCRQEAVAFALRGAEPDRATNVSLDGVLGIDGITETSIPAGGGEKPSQFRSLRPQEMVQFRKLIESGDVSTVRNMIWENPRYLVSSGDTPSILQEGSRYNALHYAVKSNNVDLCDLLLSTISDPQFTKLLFGDENMENNKEKAAILLDLYLNMPDKAMNETPLHFATKFGFKEIVDLLVSYPQCSRVVVNKFGEQPKDIICNRSKDTNPSLISEINLMLRDRFYVPVLHSEDGSQQPIIGEPFSPATPPVRDRTEPRDPMSPHIEIRALAGPMEKSEAESFRKRWKTPPRAPRSGPLAEPKFRLQDVHKGLEKVGRDLAAKLNIGWREYWPFLDTFTDLSSNEGLGLLEDFLKNKYMLRWDNSSNSVIVCDSFATTPRSPIEKTALKSRFTLSLQDKEKSNIENTTLSPMSDLCLALKSCNLNENTRAQKYEHKETKCQIKVNDCDKIENCTNFFLNPGLNPYLYVEKTCLVFEKRITLGLTRALATERDIVLECLKSETKHLQQTVVSYMGDPRFCTVDFHLIHSRIAQLIAHKLYSEVLYNDDIDTLKQALKDAIIVNEKHSEIYSSDEEESVTTYRNNNSDFHLSERKQKNNPSSHVCCLANNILKWLSDNRSKENLENVQNEEECIQMWGELYKCRCVWQTEPFMRNHRKNASVKRMGRDNNCELSTSPKSGINIVSRRLKFDSDERGFNEILSLSPTKHDGNPPVNSEHDVSYTLGRGDEKFSMTTNGNALLNDENNDKYDEDYASDNENYFTPVSSASPEFMSSDESDYEEADDGTNNLADPAAIDVFVQGDCPTKMDKAVFEAISQCEVDREKYPYVFRWKTTIESYSQSEIDSWPEATPIIESESDDEVCTPIRGTLHLGHVKQNLSLQTSTPTKYSQPPSVSSTPPLQVSKWLRVTGPNTPRSAFSGKNFKPNISFGF